MDHWRAEAFAMLADPAAVLAVLNAPEVEAMCRGGAPAPSRDKVAQRSLEVEEAARGRHEPQSRDPRSPTTELVVHLSHDASGALGPVSRVEGLGPRLLTQVRDLLTRHAHVTLTPVIDLHTGRSVNAYEHPTDVKRRSELRMLGDVFPHATSLFTNTDRPPDHDHTQRNTAHRFFGHKSPTIA